MNSVLVFAALCLVMSCAVGPGTGVAVEPLERTKEDELTTLHALAFEGNDRELRREGKRFLSRYDTGLEAIAQMESDPVNRIQFYRDIVDRYPNHKFAPQALFMIGFVYGEEMKNLVDASRALTELIRNYPDSEIAESAKWLIDNINQGDPAFESLGDMRQEMLEKKKR